MLLVLSAPALAEEASGIARGEVPDWLAPRDVPEATPEIISHSAGGVAWLMTDWQVRAVEGGYQSHFRSVQQVTDRSGLESAGAIQIEFDPHDEDVTLNYVHVIRNGKVIDHTDDLKLNLIQREDGLNNGLLDGRVSAVGNISDVRVGDVVDYATTYHVRDTLWPGHFFSTVTMQWSVPLAMQAVRISWPAERPIKFRQINTDASFTTREMGATTVYELVRRDLTAQREEADIPAWHPAYGLIAMSTMNSWEEVAEWALPLYDGDESLPDDFAAKVDQIASKWTNPSDRLTEATRLVQDTIRYVGVEIAEGSFVPRRPLEVVRLGYGDCKDKSLLLAVVLRRLGIAATPALVATSWGEELTEWAPSPAIFDHVIVRAELDGSPVWIDPTFSHQGGRGAGLVTPEYGYVLPIRTGQQDLEKIAARNSDIEQSQVVEKYDIDETAETAMRLRVETVYRDGVADLMRGRIAAQPLSALSKSNLDYYRESYPGLEEAQPLAVEDNRDENTVRMVENYVLSRTAFENAKLQDDFQVRAYSIRDILPARQSSPREIRFS